MKRNRYHRGKVPRVNFERKRGCLFVCKSDRTHGENVLFTVHFYCTKVRTIPIFILDFTLVIYLTRCYTMPVKQLQNYFRKEYRRIFQWLILSSGLASREENGHTL